MTSPSKETGRVERCFACDRKLGDVRFLVGCIDDQTVYVGSGCFRKIQLAGLNGYQPPLGGPRLYLIEFTKHATVG